MLFYSDGLVEAHDPKGEMFGFPRLRALIAEHGEEERSLVEVLLEELYSFIGEGWEQEDDITLLTLRAFRIPKLNFLELRKAEVRLRRIDLPRTPVNKGKMAARGEVTRPTTKVCRRDSTGEGVRSPCPCIRLTPPARRRTLPARPGSDPRPRGWRPPRP